MKLLLVNRKEFTPGPRERLSPSSPKTLGGGKHPVNESKLLSRKKRELFIVFLKLLFRRLKTHYIPLLTLVL